MKWGRRHAGAFLTMSFEELLPVREGVCPTDGHALDRGEMSSGKAVGRCPTCGIGWSAEGEHISAHFEVDVPNPLYVGPLGDGTTADLPTEEAHDDDY